MANKTVDIKNTIAKRVAAMFKKDTVVNLGIGIPTLVPNYLDEDANITFQSENGVLGVGPKPATDEEIDVDLFDAGSSFITLAPGGTFSDSAFTFGLIRGGRIDVTVLGALQVDEKGNLANWMIPNKMISGYGGAMDLLEGCSTVIVAMEHTNNGKHKILKKCHFPLTGANCVDYIVTEMGVMEVTKEGIVLKEIAEGLTVEEVQNATEAELIIPEVVGKMEVIYELEQKE